MTKRRIQMAGKQNRKGEKRVEIGKWGAWLLTTGEGSNAVSAKKNPGGLGTWVETTAKAIDWLKKPSRKKELEALLLEV